MTTAKAGSPQADPVRINGRFADQIVERVVDVPILIDRIDDFSNRPSPNCDEAVSVRRRLFVGCGDSSVALEPSAIVEGQAYEPAFAEIRRVTRAEMGLGPAPSVTEQYR